MRRRELRDAPAGARRLAALLASVVLRRRRLAEEALAARAEFAMRGGIKLVAPALARSVARAVGISALVLAATRIARLAATIAAVLGAACAPEHALLDALAVGAAHTAAGVRDPRQWLGGQRAG